MRRRLTSILGVAVLAAACTTPSASPSPASNSAATSGSATPATGPLVIGVLVPFTESAIDADIGASQRRAAELYLKLHNGTLGGRSVQLSWNDESVLSPATNQVRVQQFIEKDHAQILLGGAGDAAATLLRDTADAAKLVYIDTNAAGAAISRAKKSPDVFRTAPTSWQMSEPLGEWAAKSGHKDFYITYADDVFGTEAASAFADGLAKNGGRATMKAAVPEKSGDWDAVVAAIKGQPSKDVFAAFFTDDAEGFIAAWDKAGLRTSGYHLYGPGPLADAEVLKVAKTAGLGIVTAYPWSIDAPGPENTSFVEAFKAAYKDEDTGQPLAPDGYAEEMWTAMLALDRALAQTKGDASATALVPALEGLSVTGPGGAFTFDKTTHAPVQDIYVREVRASGGALANVIVDKIAGVRDPGQ